MRKNQLEVMQMRRSTPSPLMATKPINNSMRSKFSLHQLAKKINGFFKIFMPKREKGDVPVIEAYGFGSRGSSPAGGSSFGFSTGSKSRSSSILKNWSSSSSSGSSSGVFGSADLSMDLIRKATKDFTAENVIGEGGFGTVYKGQLRDGSLVAIKRAKKGQNYKCATAQFKSEIRVLSKIEHLNLVKLYGYLEQIDEKIIVVEYVGNGTLREHLDGTRGNGLELGERLDIAIDVAHGITYLHTYSDPPIIHRDIKASNILLTEKLRAKVTDFGFARMLPEDYDATHISTQIKGTAGYLDPEYLSSYQLTEKSDVYSFGVLLIELVTGRHPLEPKKGLKERNTARWAMQKLRGGDAVVALDPRVKRTPASVMATEKILKLAFQCTMPTKQTRPTMKKCVEVLWAIRKDFRDKQEATNISASPRSDGLLEKNKRKHRKKSLGIMEEDSYSFMSA
ncbi:hypothetical protein Droror1_Dr00003244 [Drosera rotundifolia]